MKKCFNIKGKKMQKLKRPILLIWCIVYIGSLLLTFCVLNDSYLKIYIFILFLFISWCLFDIRNKIVDTLRTFTIFFVLLFALGPIILYIEGHYYYKEIGNLIIISYLSFALGYCFIKTKTYKYKIHKILLPSYKYKSVLFISLIVFIIGIIAYTLYFVKNWNYIFIDDLEKGRVEAMTGNGLYLWVGSLIWLSVYMVYEQYLMNGHYKKITIVLFIISAIYSILLGFRSALVNPILVMFFMKNKKKEIKISKMVFLAFGLFAFVGIYGAIRGGGGSSFGSLIHEFKVSSVNLHYILYTFPKCTEYQKGATYFFDAVSLFNKNVDGTTMWLKKVLKLSFSGGGVTPTLIGEFFMNWGMIGVLIGMFLSGSLFKKIDVLYRNPNNSFFLSCILLGYIRPILRGGYANLSVTLLVYVIAYLCCQTAAKLIKI